MQNENLPIVAIIGRPNVGKSTLFNRLVGRRKAIVQEESGTTRDRLYETVQWGKTTFSLIDTGGHKLEMDEPLADEVNQEVRKAVVEADLLIFLVEKEGITAEDFHFAEILKKKKKEILFVVNKVDTDRAFDQNDIFNLGMTDPIFISASHGRNINELLNAITERIPETVTGKEIPWDFRLSIIGEPNAGKSTLMNHILHEQRSIISEIPGTTRDSVDELIVHKNHKILLTDTAGIQKKKKIKSVTAFYSLSRATEAIKESDVIILLYDVEKGLGHDAKAIYENVQNKRKTLLLAVNKWDLTSHMQMGVYQKDLKSRNRFLRNVPMIFLSAKTGRNVTKLLDTSITLWERHSRKIATKDLNDFLVSLRTYRLPVKCTLKFISQTQSVPPTFVIFMKNKEALKESNKSYISNQLIAYFGLEGVFPKIAFREKS